MKVFDLQLLVGREGIMGDKPRICVETTETCGKNLYVGTNDCFVHHFVIQESSAERHTKKLYTVKSQEKKYIGMKKPIVQLKAATALNYLLVNCDNTLVLLSMLDLTIAVAVSGKIKNMAKFCVNERPLNRNPFAVEICVSFSKKKVLQIFQVSLDRVVPMQEVSFQDYPRTFSVDGRFICASTSTAYYMANFEANSKQELFPITDSEKNLHAITRVGPSEFLISASNGLGVFVSTDGTSNRPPLQWSDGVFATAILQPYVVAIDDEFITVHSLLDQQQKQSVPFQGGVLVSCCEIGGVLVSTPKDIFLLTLLPLQTQLNALIAEKQVDQALSLLKVSKRRLTQDQFRSMQSRVYCMSGFVYFQDFDFENALTMFTEGGMDPRELLCLFSMIMPSKSDFKRAIPCYHEIVDVKQICNNDKAQITSCQEFLAVYLEMIWNELISFNLGNDQTNGQKPKYILSMDSNALSNLIADLFFAILLILGLLKRNAELEQFIQEQSKKLANSGFLDFVIATYSSEVVTGLQKFGCYHACALFHFTCGEVSSAMKLWHDIASKKIDDCGFPGLAFVAEQLSKSHVEANILWKNAEWILRLDQQAGVKIFTSHTINSDAIFPDNVIDFLHQYPEAVLEYLYHLVMVQKVEKEKYHTHLAVLYLDKVLKLNSNHNDALALESARSTLQNILLESNLYRIPLILGKAADARLFEEQVILHSKLGEHEKALEILVHKVGDAKAAKDYCLDKCENNLNLRRQLFQILINVYLQDISMSKSASASTAAVVELLNQHPDDFEHETVLRILPSHWSISALRQFLHSTVREPYHESRSKTIEHMLLKAELLSLQKERTELLSVPIVLKEGKLCPLCSRAFGDSAFMRYPNGVIVHTHCAKDKHVCPVTGKIFKVKKCPHASDK